jgi:tetratricopeptide (TPR) repeat protein
VRSAVALAAALAVVAAPTLRAAAAPSAVDKPWARGVSEAAQRHALQLFQDGNVFFEQAKYTEAVAKYEQALASWDHPNIRFNMAICLIHMRQPLVAWDHLKRALRFGDAPLGKRLHTEALSYVAVLEASLAEVTVRSDQPDVKVMIDGQAVLSGAGEHTLKLLPGKHQLVATRPGYATDSRALDLSAGHPVRERVELSPERVKVERENYERRWSWWAPWAVAGGGLALGAIGAGVYTKARSDIRSYDADLAALCPFGCTQAEIPSSLSSRARTARRESGIAIGLFASAGALALASGVMAILNRPRLVEERRAVPEITLAPGYVGVGVTLALP